MKLAIIAMGLWPLLAEAGNYERGLELKTAGNFSEAEKSLSAAVREKPEQVEAWFHYGTVLAWQERHAEALAAFDKGLAIAPDDYDLQVARARVLAWQGDYDRASAELEKLALRNPADDDVVVMQGRIAGWRDRPDEAEVLYLRVISRNPVQVDALTGLGDLERQRKNRAEARRYYEAAIAVDPSPDARRKLQELEEEKTRRVDFGVTGSTFDGSSRSDWWSVWTQVGWDTSLGGFWGRIEQGERFGGMDTVLEAGWEGTPADGLTARLLLGGSPDASWAPEWYGEGGLAWKPLEKWPALVGEIRHAEYVPRGVLTFRTGLDFEFGGGWKSSARWIHQDFENGTPTNGWILSLGKTYDSGFGWRVGAASGAESLDGQTLENDVLRSRTWFAGISGPIGRSWGYRADIEFEDVDGGTDRRGLSIGFHHRF
ncbi:tetratricopeptide repeat protein [Luteolibacter sp. SL250]|uniref:tetratricopeptide repeat protein n=1 Tax=Luteolibacter sp. SL250 TaxID=2995170 RepID=UPI00226F1263|nr:tetratricopeptide repeat protein [Luteolibacter sp. SL250]WAC20875.1 tetratricopeptide repeat protein [Luteolibacter sp. SL250]